MNVINPKNEFVAMPVLDVTNKTQLKNHLENDPKKLYKGAELDAIHRAIRYTQLFKQEESLEKMNEEELMQRPLPAWRTNLKDI